MSHGPQSSLPPAPADWFRRAFSHDYVRIYRHRDQAEAERTISALLALLPLTPGTRCLDLCCGFGRHLALLRGRGLDAWGVDLSGELLSVAVQQSSNARRLVQADMRALPFGQDFDLVLSFFSSFGYFADDHQNLLALKELARVLRPGGKFLMDFLNAPRVRRTLVPEDEQTFPDFSLRQRRWIDQVNRSVEKELRLTDERGERVYRESVKLYELADFQRFFSAAGLRLTQVLGEPGGQAYHDDAPRLILLGER